VAQPYSTTAQVLNRVLVQLAKQAGWDTTEVTGDVAPRIAEGDRTIDAKLAGLEIALPFATNPPILQDLSVLYARGACFRDLYSAGDPTKGNPQAKAYFDAFNVKWQEIVDGTMKIVDTTGAQVSSTKYATVTTGYPCADDSVKDEYPNFPNGPYPDPPGIDG
jgi:hypothetical protein